MFLSVSGLIGLRYSKAQSHAGFISFITFFSIAGILLGVASLITVVSVMNGFEGELKKRILGVIPHIEISHESGDIANWQSLRQNLVADPLVADVTPFIANEVLIQSNAQLKGVLLQGVYPEYEKAHLVSQHMVAGSFNELANTSYGVVIGQSLARKLQVGMGDSLRIILPQKMHFTPMGRLPVQRVFQVKGIFNIGSQVDDAVVYIHYQDSRKLNRIKNKDVAQLRVYLHDAFTADDWLDTVKLDQDKFSFNLWSDSQGALFSAVKMEKNMMWLMLSLIIAVAAFNIVSALVMVVMDKRGEIGILQTLGMNRWGILKIFLTQGLINGLWGVILGSLLGLILTFYLNDLLYLLGINILGGAYGNTLPVIIKGADVLQIILGALFMSFVATLYPAYRAASTQPAEVLRNE